MYNPQMHACRILRIKSAIKYLVDPRRITETRDSLISLKSFHAVEL